ncbi:HK97-gp10 family putative phage morphogenesis protein [Candidatus Palauibacter sp.]|uniref:HK97-gp10 family putative phage morphogenesis protein n=1 Tax=Candidatus Palauibacter sp. TaxID=3101350 RepID=UPI003CC552FB
METSIEVEGLSAVAAAMDALPGLVAERVQGDGLAAAARVVRDEARETAAFTDRTGRLRASIRSGRRAEVVDTGRGRKRVPGASAVVEVRAPHAHLIEYGTVRAPAHPFLEPAVIATRTRQLSAAVAAMGRSFKRIATQLAAGKVARITRRLAAE